MKNKMKNKLKIKNKLLILSLFFVLISCHKNHSTDPLLLPPEFDVVPNLNEKDSDHKQEKDAGQKNPQEEKDIKELKELLLKN